MKLYKILPVLVIGAMFLLVVSATNHSNTAISSSLAQQGTPSTTVTGPAPGRATLIVTGSSSDTTPQSKTVTFTVNQQSTPSFSINAAPTGLTCHANGGTAQSTITITGETGFNSLVLLTSTIMPDDGGVGATLTFGTVTGSGVSTLNVQCFHEGTYTINVEAQSGGVTKHAPLITVTVTAPVAGTFTLSASPASVTCTAGSSASTLITVASTGTFTGNVMLAAITNPSTGLGTHLVTTTVIGGSGTAELQLTCTTAGSYTVTVTGTSAGVSLVELKVPVNITQTGGAGGFTIIASPSSLEVLQGCTGQSKITLTSTGFTGELTLSTTVSGGIGVHGSLNKIHASIGINLKGNAMLTVSADKNAAVGAYVVTVTAKNAAGLSHSATVTVHVVANSCIQNPDEDDVCGSNEDDEAGETCVGETNQMGLHTREHMDTNCDKGDNLNEKEANNCAGPGIFGDDKDKTSRQCGSGKDDNENEMNECESSEKGDTSSHKVKGECGTSDDDENEGNNCGCQSLRDGESEENQMGELGQHVGEGGHGGGTGENDHGQKARDVSSCGCVTGNENKNDDQHCHNNESIDQQRTQHQSIEDRDNQGSHANHGHGRSGHGECLSSRSHESSHIHARDGS